LEFHFISGIGQSLGQFRHFNWSIGPCHNVNLILAFDPGQDRSEKIVHLSEMKGHRVVYPEIYWIVGTRVAYECGVIGDDLILILILIFMQISTVHAKACLLKDCFY
jgi:hypothetical protein